VAPSAIRARTSSSRRDNRSSGRAPGARADETELVGCSAPRSDCCWSLPARVATVTNAVARLRLFTWKGPSRRGQPSSVELRDRERRCTRNLRGDVLVLCWRNLILIRRHCPGRTRPSHRSTRGYRLPGRVKDFSGSAEHTSTWRMPLRPTVFGIVITEGRPNISDDVENDPASAGQPPGHPRVRRFPGVPLRVRDEVIGMIGVGN
jgi:hypothetical protein